MEHSERCMWVTHLVTVWLENDRPWAEKAWKMADQEAAFALLFTRVLRTAPFGSAAWHANQQLAPADYARIDWDDVRASFFVEE